MLKADNRAKFLKSSFFTFKIIFTAQNNILKSNFLKITYYIPHTWQLTFLLFISLIFVRHIVAFNWLISVFIKLIQDLGSDSNILICSQMSCLEYLKNSLYFVIFNSRDLFVNQSWNDTFSLTNAQVATAAVNFVSYTISFLLVIYW